MVKILEYDLNINPTKLIKWHGLAKLLVESNCKALGLNYFLIQLEYAQSHHSSSNQKDNVESQTEEGKSQTYERYASSS